MFLKLYGVRGGLSFHNLPGLGCDIDFFRQKTIDPGLYQPPWSELKSFNLFRSRWVPTEKGTYLIVYIFGFRLKLWRRNKCQLAGVQNGGR